MRGFGVLEVGVDGKENPIANGERAAARIEKERAAVLVMVTVV